MSAMRLPEHACPCCGHLTLRVRGGFDNCDVCYWTDDGQDDADAHKDWGGPNRATLWEARACYLRCGAMLERLTVYTRPPTADEPSIRTWHLLDNVAVALIPSTDVSPFNFLRGGSIIGMQRNGDRVSMMVASPVLRARFEPPGTGFVLELINRPEFEYTPCGGIATSSLEAIAEAAVDIDDAQHVDGIVVVSGTSGVLRIRYSALALRLDEGAPIAVEALAACTAVKVDERSGPID